MSSERAIVLAALILADDGVDITAEKLQALTKAAGVEVEPVWSNLFAKALEGKNVNELLMNIGTPGAGGPAAGGAAGGGGGGGGGAAEEKKEEEKPAEAEKEESDEDMGFGLFD